MSYKPELQALPPSLCPSVAISGNPCTLAGPVGPTQPGGTNRLANLDLNGKLVKRGVFVSYHGIRAEVTRVSRGRCHLEYLHYTGRKTGGSEWLRCESVQVVR